MKKWLMGLFLIGGVYFAAGPVHAGFPCALTCPPDQVVSNAPGQCSQIVNYPPPTDNGGICDPVDCDMPSGSSFPVNVPPDPGTTVTCTGRSGSPCSFLVTVTDDEPPVINCPADINDTVEGPTTETFTANVTDNCPGETFICDPVSGSVFPLGTTPVSCDAQDTSGNTDSCEFSVELTEFVPPPPPGGVELSGSGCALNRGDTASPGGSALALALLGFIGVGLLVKNYGPFSKNHR